MKAVSRALLPVIWAFASVFALCCSSQQEIKAVTYNIHFASRGLSGIVETLREIDADIVALQEVRATGASADSVFIARQLGYHHAQSIPYVSYGNTKWVLAFLSRYPIISREEILLGRSRRGLRITVQTNDRPIDFVTMHLTPLSPSSADWNRILARGQDRREEIRDLLQWMEGRGRHVLLGDFNVLRGPTDLFGLDEYDLLIEAGYDDADGCLLPLNSDTFPLSEETRAKASEVLPALLVPDGITLDYAFLSEGIDATDSFAVESEASDHYPLVVVLSLEDDS